MGWTKNVFNIFNHVLINIDILENVLIDIDTLKNVFIDTDIDIAIFRIVTKFS